jgi:hypothetical protein
MRNPLLLRVLLLLLLGKLLAACVPVGEGEWVPVTPDGEHLTYAISINT